MIEDDYDAEYRFDREPVGALQGLDPERVAYAGSASKALANALRLGWLVAARAASPGRSRWERIAADGGGAGARAARARRPARARRARPPPAPHPPPLPPPPRRARRRARRAPAGRDGRGVAAGLHVLVRLPGEAERRASSPRPGRRASRSTASPSCGWSPAARRASSSATRTSPSPRSRGPSRRWGRLQRGCGGSRPRSYPRTGAALPPRQRLQRHGRPAEGDRPDRRVARRAASASRRCSARPAPARR